MRSNVYAIGAVIIIAVLTGCQIEPADPVGHFVRGQMLAGAGGYEAALKELAKAIHDDPELSVAHVARGDIYFHREDYESAKDSFSSACKANPYSFDAHYKLGQTFSKLVAIAQTARRGVKKLIEGAKSAYLRAVELQPGDFGANLNLSNCYMQLGKYRLAEQYCRAAIRIDPKNPRAYSNLGVIFDSQNRLFDAIGAYNMSLELDVNQPKLLLNLGATYMRQRKYNSALKTFRIAAGKIPQDVDPWLQIGLCHFQIALKRALDHKDPTTVRDSYNSSMAAFRKVLSLNSDSDAAYRHIGFIYMSQYEYSGKSKANLRNLALAAWRRSLGLNSRQPRLRELAAQYTPKSR